ncbi:MAG: hypothetical protein DSY90_01200 [Deltaproteobacteria bacterium]|nr:MAG: hypothetical protein DSY90_01200 [Deltaproteobacteria bacterium]
MKDNMKIHSVVSTTVSIIVALIISFVIWQPALADSQWENLLERGKLAQGVAAAVTAGISEKIISEKALELKFPVCDILDAELKARIDAYVALKTLMVAGGDITYLAACSAEPGIHISSAVFARAAIDAGVEPSIVDHLVQIAFAPPPGESGPFTEESVVAGGEIREGPYTSQDSPE